MARIGLAALQPRGKAARFVTGSLHHHTLWTATENTLGAIGDEAY